MPLFKILATGSCVIALFFTLLCMLVSAAGLQSETRFVFTFVMSFVAAGFIFARIDKQEADAQYRAKLAATGSRAIMNDAIEALNRLEAEDNAENRSDFQQKAAHALMSLGEVRVTRRDLAIVATAKAIEAQHTLRRACEAGEEAQIPQLRARAEEMAKIAVYEIRRMQEPSEQQNKQ